MAFEQSLDAAGRHHSRKVPAGNGELAVVSTGAQNQVGGPYLGGASIGSGELTDPVDPQQKLRPAVNGAFDEPDLLAGQVCQRTARPLGGEPARSRENVAQSC